jgi:hypothetical protein
MITKVASCIFGSMIVVQLFWQIWLIERIQKTYIIYLSIFISLIPKLFI